MKEGEAELEGSLKSWCGGKDSNLHGIATASPSSWCVCQFRHHRKIDEYFLCASRPPPEVVVAFCAPIVPQRSVKSTRLFRRLRDKAQWAQGFGVCEAGGCDAGGVGFGVVAGAGGVFSGAAGFLAGFDVS
jgi:hypothetical protein